MVWEGRGSEFLEMCNNARVIMEWCRLERESACCLFKDDPGEKLTHISVAVFPAAQTRIPCQKEEEVGRR